MHCRPSLTLLVTCIFAFGCLAQGAHLTSSIAQTQPFVVLPPEAFEDTYGPDYDWAAENVPFFECSDPELNTAYSFRWRVYRAHIQRVEPWGHVVTEFLPPVSWAGPFNTIVGSAGHHIYEGRWIRDSSVLDGYSRFWFSSIADRRAYTAWLTNAIYARSLVDGRSQVPLELLPAMRENLEAWKASHWLPNPGCYYQSDTWDGGEDSISGDGCRVSINSAMYAELVALAAIESLAGEAAAAAATRAEAEALRLHVLNLLWDSELQFLTGFKPATSPSNHELAQSGSPPNSRCAGAPGWPAGKRVPVRELLALSTPYYFGLLPLQKSDAKSSNFSRMWDQVADKDGFAAPWGPRTAERRHPAYNFTCDHPCTWNGPSWPFETARLLTGLANFLASGAAGGSANESLWVHLMIQYARLHTRASVSRPTDLSGVPVPQHPWIGEDVHPDDGYWIARDYMLRQGEWDWQRGFKYNHATFCDLVITGLVGVRPRQDDILELRPLGCASLDYFALDGVSYHGHLVSIAWDVSGAKLSAGKGLHVWVDRVHVHSSAECRPVEIPLPVLTAMPVS